MPDDQNQADDQLIAAAQAQRKGGAGKVVAIVFLVLILIACLVGMYLLYRSRVQLQQQLNTVNSQLTQLGNTNQDLQTQLTAAKAGITDSTYITITDQGVRIKKSDDTKNLVYFTDKSAFSPFTHFTSVEILGQVMLNPSGPYGTNQCALGDSPLGVITRYLPGSNYAGKKIEEVQDPNVKKVGDRYYVYSNPQASCTGNKAVQDVISRQQQALQKAFTSIEAIPSSQ